MCVILRLGSIQHLFLRRETDFKSQQLKQEVIFGCWHLALTSGHFPFYHMKQVDPDGRGSTEATRNSLIARRSDTSTKDATQEQGRMPKGREYLPGITNS